MKNYELEDFGFEEKMPNDFGKKKETSKSKSSRKSNHKHKYEDCLVIEEDNNNKPYKAMYCTICGKLNNIETPVISHPNGYYQILSKKEIYEKYKDLKKIYVDSIWE